MPTYIKNTSKWQLLLMGRLWGGDCPDKSWLFNILNPGEASKTMDYKSVFTNLCLELQQNRSWIKGLGKNPQKSELIHWRQCLLSGGTEACSLGLRETPACIHVIQRLSQPRVACWHGFRQNSQKTECMLTRCPTGSQKKNCVYIRPPKRRG